MIKAICFDLDGVYFTEKGKKAFYETLVKFSGKRDIVYEVMFKSSEMLQFVTGKITEQEFWDFMRSRLGLRLSNQEYRNLWIKEYEIDLNVRQSVLNARSNGYLTCICSNNNIARIEALNEKFDFLRDFDVRVMSYEVGFVKPNKEIFKALINKSGVRAEEIVYSDDNKDRIQGAIDLGINAFIYERFDRFLEKLKELGVDIY